MSANLEINCRTGDQGDATKKILLHVMSLILIVVPGCAEEAAQALYPGAAMAGSLIRNQIEPRIAFRKSLGKRPQMGTLILAGVLGNTLGSIAGISLGAPTFDEDHPMSFIAFWPSGRLWARRPQ